MEGEITLSAWAVEPWSKLSADLPFFRKIGEALVLMGLSKMFSFAISQYSHPYLDIIPSKGSFQHQVLVVSAALSKPREL